MNSVEHGYTLTVDDYTNDLSVRAWHDQARPFLAKRVAEAMDSRLAPLDDRFREATFTAKGHLPGAGTEWWFERLPNRLVGELAEDVARMKLAPEPS